MAIMLALLLLVGITPAEAGTIRVGITIHGASLEGLPTVTGLRAGLQTLFAAEYGRFASLSFEPDGQVDAAGQTHVAQAEAAQVNVAQADVAYVDVEAEGQTVRVSTTLTRSRLTRSFSSKVPAGSPASLVATVTGDLAFLHFSAEDFAAFPLAPPPPMIALLPTDLLSSLLPVNAGDLEPVGLASGSEGVTISFPHGYLTLGPRLQISGETARDIFAQSGGREPLQISGAATGSADDMYLLSERARKIVVVNPRVGSREVVDAPGLSGLAACLLDAATIAMLSDARGSAGVTLYSLRGEQPRLLTAAASYVSAFSTDVEGNLWLWDVGERRVRVLARDGREVFSIKPLFKASLIPLPQQLEVLRDGSFLLGGSGELWKFESTGVPVWRLTRVPGRPSEQLPASFALAVDRSDGSFVLLDAPSRRLLSFAPSPAGDEAGLASLYERLDTRRPEDLQEGAALAAGAGRTLIELQFDTLLARRWGTDAAAASARRGVLREKMRGAARLADGLAADLLVSRADAAYLLAGEAARALMAQVPDDAEAAGVLQAAASRRQELRAALARQSEVRIVSAAVREIRTDPCGTGIEVLLRVRNDGRVPLSQLRVHANLPSASSGPSLAGLDMLAAGEQRDVVATLAPGPGWVSAAATFTLALLVTWERGSEGFTTALILAAPTAESGPDGSTPSFPAGTTAAALACRAEPSDALLAGLPDTMLGVSKVPRDPVPALAAVLDVLGSLRSQVLPGAPAGLSRPRAAVRGLDSRESAWAVLMTSLGASLGVPTGVMTAGERTFAVIDTGLPLDGVIESMPTFAPYAPVLNALSRNGSLCVPVAGLAALHTAAQGISEALGFLAGRGSAGESVAWLDSLQGRPASAALPVPFPLVLPVTRPADVSWGVLAGEIALALQPER